jgi:predicted ABC-type transport system involved in lysophospholipase L1 biosynthesis ATPase subunit
MMELVDVSRTYPSPRGPLTVLRDACLRIGPAEAITVTGPSGSGKSTLLNMLGGLDRPTTGQVLFEGRDLAALSDADLAALRNREVGFVFQLHHLLPQCTVIENVLLPTLAGWGGDGAGERAQTLLAKVGLGDRVHHRPSQLSGGELQRAAVVRALINRPRMVLADEPTGFLDRTTAASVGDLLFSLLHEEKTSLVVVTHDEALAMRGERRFTLVQGQVVEEGA